MIEPQSPQNLAKAFRSDRLGHIVSNYQFGFLFGVNLGNNLKDNLMPTLTCYIGGAV